MQKTNFEIICNFLKETKKNYCDDCLSELTNIKPRQQVNQICNGNKNSIKKIRDKECAKCQKIKITRGI